MKSCIEIGEMMTNYFKGGKGYGDGQRPSPEAMKEMGADINTKLSALLAKHDLTIEEYRQHSPEVFADDAAAGTISTITDWELWGKSLPGNHLSLHVDASPKPGPSPKASAPAI